MEASSLHPRRGPGRRAGPPPLPRECTDRRWSAASAEFTGWRNEEAPSLPRTITEMEQHRRTRRSWATPSTWSSCSLLQIELLKLQPLERRHGHIVVSSRAATPPARAAPSSGSPSTSTRAAARVVALTKPTEPNGASGTSSATSQHCPTAGEIVLFDRSWYNRAGVERVMGFCTDDAVRRVLPAGPEFERHARRRRHRTSSSSGSPSPSDEQRTRFAIRQIDPVRRWKFSPMDLESLRRWEDYTAAPRRR